MVEVLYLPLNCAQNQGTDKWIRSVKMPSLCLGAFNKLKMEVLKFFTHCWVQVHYITWHARLVPRAIWQINNKIVEIIYLLLSSAQNYRGDKWIRSVNMPGLCPGPFDELKIKVLKFFTSCWVQHKITQETSGLDRLKCPACAPGHSTN